MQQLLDLEERFWTGDARYYDQHLAANAVMVFPDPVGVMTRAAIIESIAESSRWRNVGISDAAQTQITEDTVLLTYRAHASRGEEEPPYSAIASSIYVRAAGEWRLAFHQQSPNSPRSGSADRAA